MIRRIARLTMATTVFTILSSLSIQAQADSDPEIAAILKAGGKLERDDAAPEKPVIAVNFGATKATDGDIAHVKGMTGLKKLTLNGTQVTDSGLDALQGLTHLEKLYLVDTKVGDEGLRKIQDLKNLKILSLVGAPITDSGLESLKKLENLQTLFLHGTKLGDDAVKKLQEALPKLKIER